MKLSSIAAPPYRHGPANVSLQSGPISICLLWRIHNFTSGRYRTDRLRMRGALGRAGRPPDKRQDAGAAPAYACFSAWRDSAMRVALPSNLAFAAA